MSRSVTFNGQTMFRPGGITRVNADALAQIGLLSNAIVGLVGEAEDGQPGVIITIDDPALAKTQLQGGPLADAVGLAFDPSKDPRVPGGAFRVKAVRVNQGTQASLTMLARQVQDTAAAGSTDTVINLTTGGLVASVHVGNTLRIGTEERSITANGAASVTVSPAFTAAPLIGTTVQILAPQFLFKSKKYGTQGNWVKQEFEKGSTAGSSWTTIFGSKNQFSDDLGSTSFLDVEYVGQSQQVVVDSGTSTAQDGTSLTDAGKAWGVDALKGYFVEATDGVWASKNLRKIDSNTETKINVGAWQGAPGGALTYSVLRGMVATGTATAGAAATITLAAVGANSRNFAVNELIGLVVAITSGTGAGQRRIITANTAAVNSVVTVSKNWTTQPDATSVYQLRYVTTATGTVTGSAGKATKFQTSVAVNGGLAATDLDITFTPRTSILDLVNTINANPNYRAYVPNGVNSAILMTSFDFDAGSTAVELRQERTAESTPAYPPTDPQTKWVNHFRRDAQIILDDINNRNEYVTVTRCTSGGAGTGSGKPEYTGLGTGVPGTIGDTFKYLAGGTRGISSNTNWQDGLDKLAQTRVNHVVPLICQDLSSEGYGSTATFASVAAQLAAHVDYCNGAGKSERGGYMGMKGTIAQIVAQANAFNNPDVQLCGQRVQALNVDGDLTVFDEWSLAVVAAGMRSGMDEVGEPLTHKYINAISLEQDSGWDPVEVTDANKMIENGVLFAESNEGKGYRFVRDLTTYIVDDNLAYAEGSVRDVVRYVSYGLRKYLEDRFTGRKAKPANVTAIKDCAAEFLERCRTESIIVDSLDEVSGQILHAFYNLRVKISGDIATIRVQVFPVVGINFQLNDIYLQLPVLEAA